VRIEGSRRVDFWLVLYVLGLSLGYWSLFNGVQILIYFVKLIRLVRVHLKNIAKIKVLINQIGEVIL